jgi:hypothetical protein
MNLVKLKGCRRCGGDLFLERDPEGFSITCLQCSAAYFKRLEPLPSLKNRERKIYAR